MKKKRAFLRKLAVCCRQIDRLTEVSCFACKSVCSGLHDIEQKTTEAIMQPILYLPNLKAEY